jgi:NADH:ubiquinone oxidoreductase subunit 3 (subunit A)
MLKLNWGIEIYSFLVLVIFLLILSLGLFYEWNKKMLEWVI